MKNKGKKILCAILSIILCMLIIPGVSAGIMGDVNGDGKVEASDARLALRVSVKLEILSPDESKAADVDFDGKITSADARIILRVSVGLEIIKEISPANSSFEIHFFDVGQADSALVICDKEAMLIDGGNTADGVAVSNSISDLGVTKLKYVVGTHAHEDHIGGLGEILSDYTVTDAVYAPKTGASTACYKSFANEALKQGRSLVSPVCGKTLTLGSSTVMFLGPVTESYDDINNTSIVLKITYGETSFLFTGDAEREAEQDILDKGYNLSATVIKVGHHGSKDSSTYPFLNEVMPKFAVISVGAGNTYGHPTEDALSRYRDANTKVYRTDMQGEIIVTSNKKTVSISTQRNSSAITNPTEINETEQYTYIGNINSHIFHRITCSSLPAEKNRVYLSSRITAISSGYTPCGRCKP